MSRFIHISSGNKGGYSGTARIIPSNWSADSLIVDTNRNLRRYMPKGTALKGASQNDLDHIVEEVSN